MSNMAASPGSRSLEQLKVTELRDELKKRGLNLKGVKKELFQRLEEAIEKEKQEGVVHGEHKLNEEIDHNMCTADDHEDVEGEEEALDGSAGEAGNSDSATVACQSNLSLETPIPTVEQSTIASDGVQVIPDAIESQEVSVSNKDGEQVSFAEGADLGTHNNAMLVDNAVSGNGDAMMQCESVGNEADVLEPSKNISGLEHVECVIKEAEPAIVTSDLAKSGSIDAVGDDMCVSEEKEPSFGTANLAKTERGDDIRKDGLASNMIGDVISDVAGPAIENVVPYVANENLAGHDANENDVRLHDVSNDVENSKLADVELPKPAASLETSFTKADEEGLVQPMEQQLDSSEPVDVSLVDEV